MRRFVDTIAGRALCHLAAMALVLPTVTLTVAGRAEAQVQQLPSWAVTEFKDLKSPGSKYGQAASDAVAGELAKTNRYDVVAQETVKRSIETLGLTAPLQSLVNLTRVGQDVRATTIVQGEVADYRIDQVAGGKQAIVALRMVAYNVASGLPVNGALEKGESTTRGGNVADEVLIQDAIGQAAAIAVRTMGGQQLPTATVLNTTRNGALINQGERSGFKTGDTVILTRGNTQVGTARVGVIEPDQAEITFQRTILGVAPGDRVNAVFTAPALPAIGSLIKSDGSLNRGSRRPRGSANNATLISALLVVGLIAVLLSGGNSNSQTAAEVDAEATLGPDNITPAVRISWSPNGFFKGTAAAGGATQWQIYRQGTQAPILVVQPTRRSVLYGFDTSDYAAYLGKTQVGGGGAGLQGAGSPTDTPLPATPPVQVGTPFKYQVEAVYGILSLDLPSSSGTSGTTGGATATAGGTAGGTAGTTGGTTAGTTGGVTNGGNTGGTTAGTTGGTTAGTTGGNTAGTTGGSISYFKSARSSSGYATALNKPRILSPASTSNGQPLQNTTALFSFTTVGLANITPQYVLEFSNSPDFPVASTIQVKTTTPSVTVNTLSTSSPNFTKLLGSSTIYYRVGVRNRIDRPGPVPDERFTSAKGQDRRYIYSDVQSFTRPVTPPPAP